MEQVTSRSKSNLAENCYLTSPWDPRGPMGRSDSNSVLVLSLQRNLFVLREIRRGAFFVLREIRAMQVNGLQGCHGGVKCVVFQVSGLESAGKAEQGQLKILNRL